MLKRFLLLGAMALITAPLVGCMTGWEHFSWGGAMEREKQKENANAGVCPICGHKHAHGNATDKCTTHR